MPSLSDVSIPVAIDQAKRSRNAILAWIREGKFTSGDKLPSEQALSQQLKMNNHSVRRGLAELKRAGIIINRPRVGNFVNDVRPRELVSQVAMILPDYLLKANYAGRSHPLIQIAFNELAGAFDRHSCAPQFYSFTLSEQLITEIAPLLKERGVRGALLWGGDTLEAEHIRAFADAGVLLAMQPYRPDLSMEGIVTVGSDKTPLVKQALAGLVERGHRHVLYVEYLRSAVRMSRILPEYCKQLPGGSSIRLDCAELDNTLQKVLDYSPIFEALAAPTRPTAIIIPDEVVAMTIFRYCYQHMLRIPQDLSMIALTDNTPDMHLVHLTAPNTIAIHHEVAGIMARSLKQMMDGRSPEVKNMLCCGQLVWKDSVASITPSNHASQSDQNAD